MIIDVLPSLPRGYWWRVKLLDEYTRVELVCRRWWFITHTLDWFYTENYNLDYAYDQAVRLKESFGI